MKTIQIDHQNGLTVEHLGLIAKKEATLTLSRDHNFQTLIQKGADYLKNELHNEGYIYGVTTGYGDNVTRSVPLEYVYDLPKHLMRFHGCGMGTFLTPEQTRCVLAVRLASLCKGFSGVNFELLTRLEQLLTLDILPMIPSEGSVGASGDLTPLSYIAAVLYGERTVWHKDQIRPSIDVLNEYNITPYTLQPKEALAIMNGTAVMTAIVAEAYLRAEYLVELSSRLTALTCIVLEGNPVHFDAVLFSAKPHKGQENVASLIRADLINVPDHFPTHRLQDRYSTRCAPHVIGVLADFLPKFKEIIETEINSACDNPLIDLTGDVPRILSGGHFYGGHIAFVADSLKNLVANIADLLDRQLATLVDPKMNHGLPANISGSTGPQAVINHGLKAVQIAASSWTAEALKNTMPASVFSRSTESHNQDKVSMGTIAARDSIRVLELTEQVCAAQMIATLQAIRIRLDSGNITKNNLTKNTLHYIEAIHDIIPYITDDQPLDDTLRTLVELIKLRKFPLYGAK
ncbi:MAG TPA: histidine ammonia-lyase [Holosporales bacterium]|nr:histidine ammonia-lyase [Holosporales bacterium]